MTSTVNITAPATPARARAGAPPNGERRATNGAASSSRPSVKAPPGGCGVRGKDVALGSGLGSIPAANGQKNGGTTSRINSLLRRRVRHHLAGPDDPENILPGASAIDPSGVNGTHPVKPGGNTGGDGGENSTRRSRGREDARALINRDGGGVILAGEEKRAQRWPAIDGDGANGGGSGGYDRNSRRMLAQWVKGDEDDSDAETVCSLRMEHRGKCPSAAAAATVAGAAALVEFDKGGRADKRATGHVKEYCADRTASRRRELTDWVKGAGVDDSDGDTNLSGVSPRSSMKSSPLDISPRKQNGFRVEGAGWHRGGSVPRSPPETTPRRNMISAEQSAGQETGSFDAAGQAIAAAAAAAALTIGREEVEDELAVEEDGKAVEDGAAASAFAAGVTKGTAGVEDGVVKAECVTAALSEEELPASAREQKGKEAAMYHGAVRSDLEADVGRTKAGRGKREARSVVGESQQRIEAPMAASGDEAVAVAATAVAPSNKTECTDEPTHQTASPSAVTNATAGGGAIGVEAGAGAGVDSVDGADGVQDPARRGGPKRGDRDKRATVSLPSSHSLLPLPPVLTSSQSDAYSGGRADGGSSGGGRVASLPLMRSDVSCARGGSVSSGGTGGSESGGGGTVGTIGTGSGRRRSKEKSMIPGNLRPRRSLSSGSKPVEGSTKLAFKEAREGCLSDGGEIEELSPIGREIAYMKERRGNDSGGGLGLGAWPNKAKKDADAAKVIYLGDIDFDAPGKATATDILVRQHRTRVRVKRVKDKDKAKKRRKARAKVQRRRIRNGKPLHPEEDEVEYMLTIGMMLGLRVAVGRQANPLAKRELTVEDFYQVDKYTFPPSGATGCLVTPSHKLGQTFKFKDYAPKVFRKIREHFGVDKMRYMLSVAGNYNFLEFISNAKSGEFFFFSHDERFMIKTMKSSETKFLRRILPHYYEHVKVHPETFLVRFYGMYRVKMHHINRKVHFIVMNSFLDTYKEIHRTFDLKGSSVGRSAKPGEKVLKDNDLAERQGKLHLGSQRETFLKVVRADSEFLARMKIMDYSLLTGIHDRAQPAEEDQRHQSPRRYSKFFNFADEAENKSIPGFKRVPALSNGDKKPSAPGNSRNVRTVNGDQSEDQSCDGSSTSKNRSSSRSAKTLKSASGADDMMGHLSDDEGQDVVLVSDDEARGLWSATGTGTEEDTGGDYTEGDGECETAAENTENPPYERSLSRCSTAQENLAHWAMAELPRKEAGANEGRGRSAGRSARNKRPPTTGASHRPTPMPRLAPPETGVSCAILRRADGGIDSELGEKRGRDIYFMGIIDILQEYNARKHGETLFKSLAHDRAEISCVDPHSYCQRFNDFLERHTD